MGNTFTSWSGLVLALQQEVAEATAEVIDVLQFFRRKIYTYRDIAYVS